MRASIVALPVAMLMSPDAAALASCACHVVGCLAAGGRVSVAAVASAFSAAASFVWSAASVAPSAASSAGVVSWSAWPLASSACASATSPRASATLLRASATGVPPVALSAPLMSGPPIRPKTKNIRKMLNRNSASGAI